MFKPSISAAALVAGVLAATEWAAPAQAADLYLQDFEAGSAGIGGAGFLYPTGGYAALGFGSQMLRNWEPGDPAAATALSFTLNTAQSAVTLVFDLAVIDSWDGDAALGGCCNTDLFNVKLDGTAVFSADFNNVWGQIPGWAGPDTQTFPRDGRMLAGPVANLAGEWNGDSGYDSAYRLTIDLGDLAAGTHLLEFHASGAGWQAGSDESFAIDNLRVSAVPEPQAWVLLLAGLGLLGVNGRARRR